MTTELRTKATGNARTAPRRQTVRKARFDVRMTDESKELLMKAATLRNVNPLPASPAKAISHNLSAACSYMLDPSHRL